MTYFVKSVHPRDQLHELLPKANVVFISAPHTPETEKMMGPDEFRLMKQGPISSRYPGARLTTPTHW